MVINLNNGSHIEIGTEFEFKEGIFTVIDVECDFITNIDAGTTKFFIGSWEGWVVE